MKKTSEPVVFFGSGPVAAESLRLLAGDFAIEAVITKPRPAHHRGSVPVLELAEKLGFAIFTATDKSSLDELFAGAHFASRIGILVDFGIIVSQKVIDYFPLGIVNSHFSLLPEWRGADPITFSILSGQAQTGVSLMLLVQKMDEGPLLGQSTLPISAQTTAPGLTAELVKLSHQLLAENVPKYMEGDIKPATQDSSHPPTYSRKLTKEDGKIDWQKPAAQIEREIRAFAAWPKSYTNYQGLDIIVTAAHVVNETGTPGTTALHDKTIVFYTSKQALAIDKLKPAGKGEMTSAAFIAGHRNQ